MHRQQAICAAEKNRGEGTGQPVAIFLGHGQSQFAPRFAQIRRERETDGALWLLITLVTVSDDDLGWRIITDPAT